MKIPGVQNPPITMWLLKNVNQSTDTKIEEPNGLRPFSLGLHGASASLQYFCVSKLTATKNKRHKYTNKLKRGATGSLISYRCKLPLISLPPSGKQAWNEHRRRKPLEGSGGMLSQEIFWTNFNSLKSPFLGLLWVIQTGY